MGREPKKRFSVKFEPSKKSWTASDGEYSATNRQPTTALKRVAAQQGVELDPDEVAEYIQLPSRIRRSVEEVQKLAAEVDELYKKREELQKLRMAVGEKLENDFGLNRAIIGKLLKLSGPRIGTLLDKYYETR